MTFNGEDKIYKQAGNNETVIRGAQLILLSFEKKVKISYNFRQWQIHDSIHPVTIPETVVWLGVPGKKIPPQSETQFQEALYKNCPTVNKLK